MCVLAFLDHVLAMTAKPHLAEAVLDKLVRQVGASVRIAQKKLEKSCGHKCFPELFVACVAAIAAILRGIQSSRELGAGRAQQVQPAASAGSVVTERWPTFAEALAEEMNSSAADISPDASSSENAFPAEGRHTAIGKKGTCCETYGIPSGHQGQTTFDLDAGTHDVPQALIESPLQDRIACIMPVFRQELIASITNTTPTICHADILRRNVASHPRLVSGLLMSS